MTWLGDDVCLTSGCNKTSQREIAIYDLKSLAQGCVTRSVVESVGTNVLEPVYDPIGILYLLGKGEIIPYEVWSDTLLPIPQKFKASDGSCTHTVIFMFFFLSFFFSINFQSALFFVVIFFF